MAWRIIILYLPAVLLCISVHYPNEPSPYEALKQYKFPVGLLPEGVTGYSLNNATGEFSAHLNGSCSFMLDNSYELKYLPVIRGMISQGRLQKLSGVSVKVVLWWLNIVKLSERTKNSSFRWDLHLRTFLLRILRSAPSVGVVWIAGEAMEEEWREIGRLLH